MASQDPFMYRVSMPREPSYAFHIGTHGSLARRRPQRPLPRGSIVAYPAVSVSARDPGALAAQVLALPRRDANARYHPPVSLAPSVMSGWQWSSDSGLELPVHVVEEIAFSRRSGMGVFEPPDLPLFNFDHGAVSSCAWWVLASVPAEMSCAVLADLAFRLDLEGPAGETSLTLAAALSQRWYPGNQALQAAKNGKVWLNPRGLRWIIRELAAVVACVADGERAVVSVGTEGQLLHEQMFPHLVHRQADVLDVVMAAWLLHHFYNGFGVGGGERPIDAVEVLTVLGAHASERFRSLQRLVSWADVWAVRDDHPVRNEAGWNGRSPSELRDAFKSSAGLATSSWFAFVARVALCPILASTTQPTLLFRVEDFGLGAEFTPAKRMLDTSVATTLVDLGRAELSASQGYSGLGTLDQAEVSPLTQRPLLRFGDHYAPTSVDALVRKGIDVVPDVVSSALRISRREVNGTVGRMFEAHCADVVNGLDPTRHVVVSNDEIRSRSNSKQNGDAIVATDYAAIMFEFSLQTPGGQALRGDRSAIDRVLQRYIAKADQAKSTPLHDLVTARIGTMTYGKFVVVDDPLAISAAHVHTMAQLGGSGDPFLISLVDLEILVDAANHGHGFPAALLTWAASRPVRPFAHKLFDMERLTGETWIEQAVTRIERLINNAIVRPRRAA